MIYKCRWWNFIFKLKLFSKAVPFSKVLALGVGAGLLDVVEISVYVWRAEKQQLVRAPMLVRKQHKGMRPSMQVRRTSWELHQIHINLNYLSIWKLIQLHSLYLPRQLKYKINQQAAMFLLLYSNEGLRGTLPSAAVTFLLCSGTQSLTWCMLISGLSRRLFPFSVWVASLLHIFFPALT